MGWGRRPVSPVGYIVTELIFGGIFSLIVFLVSLAIGSLGSGCFYSGCYLLSKYLNTFT